MRSRLFLMMISLPFLGLAQMVNIKSVPVATGDQFMIYPSQNFGMAGLTVAYDDSLFDPFCNPAKGTFYSGTAMFTIPSFYTISNDLSSARNFPIGITYGSDEWFGGGAFSLQQLKGNNSNGFEPLLGNNSANNAYFHGFMGKRLTSSGASVGIGISWANLKGVDGVDLLYANSSKISQSGTMLNIRAGVFKMIDNKQNFELLFLYNRFRMKHNVSYWNWTWMEDTQQNANTETIETNYDRSDTYGLHTGYTRVVGSKGWRIGTLFSGNWKTHPKIPNYELQNIPRDPGDSQAYNLGFGLSHKKNRATFGFDLIYEPIWSHTWADAGEETETVSGKILQPGDITVDNDFTFSNIVMRFGINSNNPNVGFQFGFQVRSISYNLDQFNYIEENRRDLEESWMEWTAAWGWRFKFKDFNFLYQGTIMAGAGRPGVSSGGRWATGVTDASADFIVAPSGSLTLEDAYVFTHRFTFMIPID